MNFLYRLFLLPICSATLLMTLGVSFAEDVAVHYTIVSSEPEGTLVGGAITVEVRNQTSEELQNVHVRLDERGPVSLAQEVLDLGSIPGGQVRMATSGILVDQEFLDSGRPIVWLVDYDDPQLSHEQAVLPGGQLGQ